MLEENRMLKDREADLQMQLKETIQQSESSETDLVNQLQDSREDTKILSADLQRLTEDHRQLTLELSQTKEKLKESEVMNFDLEEQLVRCSSDVDTGGEEQRKRAYTVMENSLEEKTREISELTQKLSEVEAQNQQLTRDLSDAHTSLENQQVLHEAHRRSEDKSLKQLQSEMDVREERESALRKQCAKLHSQNQSLNEDLERLRVGMEQERCELREKLERESSERLALMERERNSLKAELGEVNGLVESETSALKFKLSSQNIELQQVKEHSSKKDRTISELRSQLKNTTTQLGETAERYKESEQQVEELKLELQDVEQVLHSNQDEMSSLHEQLTEKTLGRDQERASMLRLQTEWDSEKQRLLAENMEMKRQADRLDIENEDIRKAFKKLLEQKVTLWQHADDLEQEQIAMATWLDSKKVTECMNCDLTFTVFARKHHCRSCGKVFCAKCCDKKIQLAVSKDPARVCDKCYERINQKRTPMASSVINAMEFSESFLLSQPRPPRPASSSGGHTPNGNPVQSQWRSMSSNSLNIERTVELSGNSLHAKLRVQNQDSELEDDDSHSSTPLTLTTSTLAVPSQSTLTSSTDDHALTRPDTADSRTEGEVRKVNGVAGSEDNDDGHSGDGIRPSSYRSVHSMEYSVSEDMRQREAERELKEVCSIMDTDFRISSVHGETIDEDYYLIDTQPSGNHNNNNRDNEASFPVGLDNHPGGLGLDMNALASKLAKLEDSVAPRPPQHGQQQQQLLDEEGEEGRDEYDYGNGVNVENRLVSEAEGKVGSADMTEVLLEGGGVHKVSVVVDKKGTAVAWEFSTEPKGIAFGICYKDKRNSTKEDEVLPLKRCMSHKTTLTGEYYAQKTGIYILKFDNCHSKFSGRKLNYRVWKRLPN